VDYIVSWVNEKTGRAKKIGSLRVEAKDAYDAKKLFLEEKLKGTTYQETPITLWLPRVRVRRMVDNRIKTPLPSDTTIEEAIRSLD